MSYTTEAKIEKYLGVDIDASLSAQVIDWITGVEGYIDKYTGKTFGETVAETRYFDGSGERILNLGAGDDLISVTSFKILNSDGTELASLTEGQSNDYMLYPLNDSPKYQIRLSVGASVGAFYSGSKKVEIAGNWGYEDVPKDIELVATMLVAEIINVNLNGGNGRIKNESLGDYSVAYEGAIANNFTIKNTLDQYKVWEI